MELGLTETISGDGNLLWVGTDDCRFDWARCEQFLAVDTQHSSVRICSLGIDDVGVACIARGLARNTSLRAFDLHAWNLFITPQGAKLMGKALEANAALQTLSICRDLDGGGSEPAGQGGRMGDELCGALALGLQSNKTLRALDLGNLCIGAEGATAMGEALRRNSSLRSLGLSNSSVGLEGVKALAGALRANRVLSELRVDHRHSDAESQEASEGAQRGGMDSEEACVALGLALRGSLPRAGGGRRFRLVGVDVGRAWEALGLPRSARQWHNDVVMERWWQDRMLAAFGMGMHPRLGGGCMFRGMGHDAFRLVGKAMWSCYCETDDAGDGLDVALWKFEMRRTGGGGNDDDSLCGGSGGGSEGEDDSEDVEYYQI